MGVSPDTSGRLWSTAVKVSLELFFEFLRYAIVGGIAFLADFGTYAEFGKVRTWLDSFPNLYCIGRNGQHRYNNMDHSMLCGLEAARSLLGGTDKSALWNVNTEEEYHESK